MLSAVFQPRVGVEQEAGSENWIGMVCQQTSPAAIAEAAIEDAKFVCTRQYGDAPDVTLHGRLDLTFSCESFLLYRICASESRPATDRERRLAILLLFRPVQEHNYSGNAFSNDILFLRRREIFFVCHLFIRLPGVYSSFDANLVCHYVG